MKNNYLLIALLSGLSSVAAAGNIIISSTRSLIPGSGTQQVLVYDENHKEFLRDMSIAIESGAASTYNFFTKQTGGRVLTADFLITKLGDPTSAVNYLGVATPHQSLTPGFLGNNITGRDNQPIGESQQLVITPATGSSFAQKTVPVTIYPKSDGGNIDVTDLSGVANKITAITTSVNAADDQVPLTITSKSANNVQSAHFVFKVDAPGTATLSENHCDIDTFTNDTGKCSVNVIPQSVGKTKITFDKDASYWVPSGTPNVKNRFTNLPEVSVNVGTLYAGYQDDTIGWKDGTALHTELLTASKNSGHGVQSLFLNQESGFLYAIDESNVSRLDLSTATPSLNKTWASVATHNGEYLTAIFGVNQESSLIVGTTFGKIYKITNGGSGQEIAEQSLNSLTSAAFDPYSNTGYLINQNDLQIKSVNKDTWTDIDGSKAVIPQDLFLTLVSNDSFSYMLSKNVSTDEIDVYKVNNESHEFEKISVADNSLVKKLDNSEVFTLATIDYGHTNKFFVATSANKLFTFSENGEGKIEFTPLTLNNIIATNDGITDMVFDKNFNLYLSTSTNGVYKCTSTDAKYSNFNCSKLDLYSPAGSYPNSLVIDSNLR